MIIFDVFGKIDKLLVSEKLQIYIYNLPDEWKSSIKERIYDEMSYRKYKNNRLKQKDFPRPCNEYNRSFLHKVVLNSIPAFNNNKFLSIESSIDFLVDNMICLELETLSKDKLNLDWNDNPFEYRANELSHSTKIFNFLKFLRSNIRENPFNMLYTIDNSHNMQFNDRILSVLNLKLFNARRKFPSKNELIKILVKFGKGIDHFIQTENDYFKFNYVLSTISDDSNYTYFHYVKSYALLEMLLLRPNQYTNEIDKILVDYLEPTYKNEAKDVAVLLRQMRNKISHGDSKGYNQKAEEFALKHMKDFSFDYYEFSRGSWILSHTTILLDNLLKKVLVREMKLINN